MKSQRVVTKTIALKHALVDARISQTWLGKKARIEKTRLSRILNGHAFADRRESRAIARVLGCERDELFTPRRRAAPDVEVSA
jgi:hypothetical protein